mmetsp:Transcript_13702/g.48363  ORF Transcript_13702/g.48363 Transcript_13702/m.48363 type:complete len:175 (+) Transcript_13702:87-611(+)|eukprot:CAMPEP_0203864348 /NCGR_PEP_ID=MMETSP0359-20131031/14710_1 /ASSEMBLY_ACC=CAM_ASM_000338 /TAXON_ID=268821 /ORGANISM="Scrippsiella Hangoei, Strain SHTV-5" /LENGTH=174 /DNA_ID=CAMNT_0050782067 /DNA_START=77 /DNA_END=601 /DNA_ORIENTATION=+
MARLCLVLFAMSSPLVMSEECIDDVAVLLQRQLPPAAAMKAATHAFASNLNTNPAEINESNSKTPTTCTCDQETCSDPYDWSFCTGCPCAGTTPGLVSSYCDWYNALDHLYCTPLLGNVAHWESAVQSNETGNAAEGCVWTKCCNMIAKMCNLDLGPATLVSDIAEYPFSAWAQ